MACMCRNDGNEFSGSLFQKVNEKVDVGAQLSWSGANSMRFGLAAKFCAHPDTTFRVSNVRAKLGKILQARGHSMALGQGMVG